MRQPLLVKRTDTCTDAVLAELERKLHLPIRARLHEEPLDGQLQIVHGLEAEVGPLGDPAHDQSYHGLERPIERSPEADVLSHSSPVRPSLITPQPTISSPSMRHPICPGAAAPTARFRQSSISSCVPAISTSGAVHGTSAAW